MERSQKMVQSRAHPHRRGEHFTIPTSPVVCGLIPTGVGNTHVQAEIGPRHGAHPHGRGEHLTLHAPVTKKAGSSPRAWGTPAGCTRSYEPVGLILTGVGNTARDRLPRPRLRAHPHGCGEHTGEFRAIDVDPGSSPRVWGTPAYQCHYHAQSRLIPTGVGNTTSSRTGSLSSGAHPHGCGEHVNHATSHMQWSGSSPRVWGTHSVMTVSMAAKGLIPTGVGNTFEPLREWTPNRAHPHGCGEHSR